MRWPFFALSLELPHLPEYMVCYPTLPNQTKSKQSGSYILITKTIKFNFLEMRLEKPSISLALAQTLWQCWHFYHSITDQFFQIFQILSEYVSKFFHMSFLNTLHFAWILRISPSKINIWYNITSAFAMAFIACF